MYIYLYIYTCVYIYFCICSLQRWDIFIACIYCLFGFRHHVGTICRWPLRNSLPLQFRGASPEFCLTISEKEKIISTDTLFSRYSLTSLIGSSLVFLDAVSCSLGDFQEILLSRHLWRRDSGKSDENLLTLVAACSRTRCSWKLRIAEDDTRWFRENAA